MTSSRGLLSYVNTLCAPLTDYGSVGDVRVLENNVPIECKVTVVGDVKTLVALKIGCTVGGSVCVDFATLTDNFVRGKHSRVDVGPSIRLTATTTHSSYSTTRKS